MSHVIEHGRGRQAAQHRRPVDNLIPVDVELRVPAEIRHTSRQRFYHVERHDRRRRIVQTEANAPHPAGMQASEFGVGHRRVKNRHAAGASAQLADGIERHRILRRVVPRRDHHDPVVPIRRCNNR